MSKVQSARQRCNHQRSKQISDFYPILHQLFHRCKDMQNCENYKRKVLTFKYLFAFEVTILGREIDRDDRDYRGDRGDRA